MLCSNRGIELPRSKDCVGFVQITHGSKIQFWLSKSKGLDWEALAGTLGGIPNKGRTGPRVTLVANYTKSQALHDVLKLIVHVWQTQPPRRQNALITHDYIEPLSKML